MHDKGDASVEASPDDGSTFCMTPTVTAAALAPPFRWTSAAVRAADALCAPLFGSADIPNYQGNDSGDNYNKQNIYTSHSLLPAAQGVLSLDLLIGSDA